MVILSATRESRQHDKIMKKKKRKGSSTKSTNPHIEVYNIFTPTPHEHGDICSLG